MTFHTATTFHTTTFRVALFLGACLIAATVSAAEWGTLKGRFVFDGKKPEQAKINPNKDVEVCSKHPLLDESLVVGDEGGLANVVVFLRTKTTDIHPDYAAKATEKVVLDNKDCRFQPHMLAIRTGQPLEIKNSDPVGHNTNATLRVNPPFNVIVASGGMDTKTLKSAETLPVEVTCNIHPWMKGWLVVRPDPYFAVSEKDGTFEIKNLPAGKDLEFQVWQEKSGYVQKAKIGGKPADWARGRFKMTIKPGDNDLGEINLDPVQFAK